MKPVAGNAHPRPATFLHQFGKMFAVTITKIKKPSFTLSDLFLGDCF